MTEIVCMRENLQPGTRRGPATSPGSLPKERKTMETTRQTEYRRDRHAKRLARRAIGAAGTPTNVGKALGRSPSATCHDATDRVHPDLRPAFNIMLRMEAHPDVDVGAFVDAVNEAYELSQIVHAETEVLKARGIYLMQWEDETCSQEDQAALMGPASHSEALRKHGRAVMELAAILDELLYRGIDLHEQYRAARVAA